jgi:hypothetical protein
MRATRLLLLLLLLLAASYFTFRLWFCSAT